jgi:hypothetical protein
MSTYILCKYPESRCQNVATHVVHMVRPGVPKSSNAAFMKKPACVEHAARWATHGAMKVEALGPHDITLLVCNDPRCTSGALSEGLVCHECREKMDGGHPFTPRN